MDHPEFRIASNLTFLEYYGVITAVLHNLFFLTTPPPPPPVLYTSLDEKHTSLFLLSF